MFRSNNNKKKILKGFACTVFMKNYLTQIKMTAPFQKKYKS